MKICGFGNRRKYYDILLKEIKLQKFHNIDSEKYPNLTKFINGPDLKKFEEAKVFKNIWYQINNEAI